MHTNQPYGAAPTVAHIAERAAQDAARNAQIAQQDARCRRKGIAEDCLEGVICLAFAMAVWVLVDNGLWGAASFCGIAAMCAAAVLFRRVK